MFRALFLLLIIFFDLYALENKMGSVGYVRIQTTLQNEKANSCFKAYGADTKYRLGNECETWLELGVFQNLKFENGIKIHNQIRPVFSGANNKKIDFVRFDEAYSEVFNLFENSVSFWAGRRFYKRYVSYISDYFFLNMSGDGAGVNNLDLGPVVFSYSFIFSKVDPKTVAGNEKLFFESHDLRFEKKFDDDVATLFLNYMRLEGKNLSTTQNMKGLDGYAVGLLYESKQALLGLHGKNMSALLYGEGLAKGAGAYSPYLQNDLVDQLINTDTNIKGSKTFRAINYNGFENGSFGFMSNIVYQNKDDKKFTNTYIDWLSLGVRPYFFLNRYSRFVLEAGYDYINDRIAKQDHYLAKFSSAVEFAFEKGIWKKPVLRLYYTKALWDENSKGQVGGAYYANRSSGDNIGMQLEYGW